MNFLCIFLIASVTTFFTDSCVSNCFVKAFSIKICRIRVSPASPLFGLSVCGKFWTCCWKGMYLFLRRTCSVCEWVVCGVLVSVSWSLSVLKTFLQKKETYKSFPLCGDLNCVFLVTFSNWVCMTDKTSHNHFFQPCFSCVDPMFGY